MNPERTFLVLFVLFFCLNSVRSKRSEDFVVHVEQREPRDLEKAKAKVSYVDGVMKANR